MSRPIPEGDTATYEAEVTIKFRFLVEAEDDIQADAIAMYDWQDNLYSGEIEHVSVDIIEEDEEEYDYGVPDVGDATDAGIAGE